MIHSRFLPNRDPSFPLPEGSRCSIEAGRVSSEQIVPVQQQEEPDIDSKIRKLYVILQELQNEHNTRGLRTLMQDCNEKGYLHLLTIKEPDLSFCELDVLPEEVCFLPNLQTLMLVCNKMESLPEKLILLNSLRKLDLAGNCFNKIPEVVYKIAIDRLTNKKHFSLYLRENPMKCLPLELKAVIRTKSNCDSYFSPYYRKQFPIEPSI